MFMCKQTISSCVYVTYRASRTELPEQSVSKPDGSIGALSGVKVDCGDLVSTSGSSPGSACLQ